MKSSISYLEDALTRMGDEPDSKKAEQLKMTKQALWNYRNGVSKMDNFACIMIGNYLGIDPMAIIAACEEERAKSEEKQGFWRDFRSTLGTLVATLVLTTLLMMTPTPANAAAAETANIAYDKCLLCQITHQNPPQVLLFRPSSYYAAFWTHDEKLCVENSKFTAPVRKQSLII